MAYQSATQPLCRYCGERIGKWTDRLYCYPEPPRTEVVDHYSGRVQKLAVPRHRVGVFRTKAELEAVLNEKVVSVRRDGETISEATTWDGTSYRDEFFCSDNHAKLFGYVFARAGYGTTTFDEAKAKEAAPEAAR